MQDGLVYRRKVYSVRFHFHNKPDRTKYDASQNTNRNHTSKRPSRNPRPDRAANSNDQGGSYASGCPPVPLRQQAGELPIPERSVRDAEDVSGHAVSADATEGQSDPAHTLRGTEGCFLRAGSAELDFAVTRASEGVGYMPTEYVFIHR